MKPGWKTSEAWFTLAAQIVGALLTSGLLADGSKEMRIAGVVALVLSSLGYQANRTILKKGEQ